MGPEVSRKIKESGAPPLIFCLDVPMSVLAKKIEWARDPTNPISIQRAARESAA